MITFIYGSSGHGKSYETAKRIREDLQNGIHTFLIVPEQQAVASERKMLSMLDDSAQLRLEVLNFSRLYNRVCREYGGLEYNYITKPAKHLLMWRTLHELEPLLGHYSDALAKDATLPDTMLSAINEFKANCITPHSLERASDKLADSPQLKAKLRDISLICSAYNAFVSENFSDAADDHAKLEKVLSEHDFFKGCNVYIDSFTSFTGAELAVIDRIFGSAANTTVTIALTREAARNIYSESISATEKRLIESAKRRGGYTVCELSENKRAKESSLAFLAQKLWDLSSESVYEGKDVCRAITLERCATPYAEAEAAARWTLELMRSGYRCRDIVVVTRDAESYRGIIEPAFERNGIPFFFSEKSELSSKALLKFIISAFRIKRFGWRTDDVISHVKTGMYGIENDKCDMFESYLGTWNIKGEGFLSDDWTMNPDGYGGNISKRGERILSAANEVRRMLCEKLIPLFTRLDAADDPAQMSRALYEFLVECNVEERLSSLGAKHASLGNVKEAQEYLSLYGITLEAMATVAELLPEEKISSEEYAEALKCVFDATDIGTIPTSPDEVLIGSASMLRADDPRCVIVLGLCEGEFPRRVSDAGLLSPSDRKKLSELDVNFTSDGDTRASDELMFVQKAFSLPSERLILTFSENTADMREKRPSLPYNRVKKLFPSLEEHVFDERDIGYLVGTAEDLARYLYSENDPVLQVSLAQALCRYSDEYSYAVSGRYPNISDSSARISAEVAEEIFGRNMSLSQARLEKYVKCHFGYYCSYILGLREESKARFGALDMGNFVHYLLENMLKSLLDDDGRISKVDAQRLEELATTTVQTYISSVIPKSEKNSGRLGHLCERLKKLSMLLVENIIEEFEHSEFSPAFFEMRIGKKDDEVPPLEFVLNDGSRVSLVGVIDRVDIFRKDGTVYVRVVDYKTGAKEFSIDDLSLGLNTQMLLYLFSLCSQGSGGKILRCDKPPVPAGVMYLSSDVPMLELESYADRDETLKRVAKAFDRSGLLLNDEEVLRAMNDSLSPDFLAGVKADKDGNISGKALTDVERFYELRVEVEQTIADIVTEMKSGDADAVPLIYKGESPCDYCEMRPVCRISDSGKGKEE